ncbi:MAG: DUF308 domain-containing protein [Clostridia bacterium]|nr:DUF308 domain-containing protein [Clostridia bacterium]
MRAFLKHLPVILLALFEMIAGVMLFIKPDSFTTIIIAIFGGVLIAVGIVNLFRYIKGRKEGNANALSLTIAVIVTLVGIVALFFPGPIFNWVKTAFGALIYAIMLIISGVFKLGLYIDYRQAGVRVNFLHVISGILAIVLGVVIILRPYGDNEKAMWIITGIMMIGESLVDIASLVLNVVNSKKKPKEKPIEVAAEE